MTFLFAIFTATLVLIFLGRRKLAILLALINLALCLAMFYHHITLPLPIRL